MSLDAKHAASIWRNLRSAMQKDPRLLPLTSAGANTPQFTSAHEFPFP